ncbi:MAG: thioesterase domain-containing protein, partial [Sporichthyaceae bacterium]|nr:thioesterase domain-containing protein [Sporichthyaceae bacterium]
MDAILRQCGLASGPSYFAVGGRVSDEQVRSVGMTEDLVHMKGPAEMIRDDLAGLLPEFMVPNRVVVLDKLPLTANGKVDLQALDATAVPAGRPFVAPRTRTEQRLAELWCGQLKLDQASGSDVSGSDVSGCDVSVRDDFFECGGNSLIAVGLVNRINRELGCALPVQVLFEAPTIEQLALRVARDDRRASSRLVRLHAGGSGSPVFCWPGLGGYPMNLRLLAVEVGLDRPFYGVQAQGINPGETPYSTVEQMAAADVQQIRRCQPVGPYALWGYSFGARVAFETAYQLERSGQVVEHLFLIAPGSPMLRVARRPAAAGGSSYRDPAYVTILFSVFARQVTGPALAQCLRTTRDEESFVAFVSQELTNLDADLIRRIVSVVDQTYRFRYARWELARRRIDAP